MNVTLRVIFIIATILTFAYMWHKVRKSQVRIQDLLGWFLIGFGLIIISLFPEIVSLFTNLFGFMSDTNVVFLIMIFLLFILSFRQMLRISTMKNEIEILTQKIAILNAKIDKTGEDIC